MRTSVIGYPRVGALRELKFATEKYFRNEITGEELQQVGKEIRKTQWKIQKESGLDFIPSNDFSFYDNLLDTAVLFHIIPKRYLDLGLSQLDTYFAMARGYQGEEGDVKALAMKKWFNTNYHYMVAEIEDNTEISLCGTKPFDEFTEARELGILTKPVVMGPFTLLKLARYTGKKSADDFAEDVVKSYSELIEKFGVLGAEWIQFDEPYLVYDLTKEDSSLFVRLYEKILASKGSTKILLQTYFGDIRDVYQKAVHLDFDGIGLDFMEGTRTKDLIAQNGFPKAKTLFAGLINGKNIWRNNYEKTLDVLAELKNSGIDPVLSTSCSLLHVPYTLENEKKLSVDYTKHFAFAEEKLSELAELKLLSESEDATKEEEYQVNRELFKGRINCCDEAVQKRVKNIQDSDFTRLPVFEEREAIQKKEFALPLFPTTTIGSFPQTGDVKANRRDFKQGKITGEQCATANLQISFRLLTIWMQMSSPLKPPVRIC